MSEKPEWFRKHEEDDRRRFDEISLAIAALPKKQDIEDVLFSVTKRVLKTSYGGLLIVAGIVGALIVIGGGFKTLLGWVGFSLYK